MKVPVFGDERDIFLSKGMPSPFTGEPMAKKVRIRAWQIRGEGPSGMKCADCDNLRAVRKTKTFYKCGLRKITHGPGTDIGYRDPACADFSRSTASVPARRAKRTRKEGGR